MKKIIIIFLLYIITLFNIYSYEVELPNTLNKDVKTESQIISSDNNYYTNLSKTINKYLWYIMWVISFAMIIYAWTLLISSNWNQEDLQAMMSTNNRNNNMENKIMNSNKMNFNKSSSRTH